MLHEDPKIGNRSNRIEQIEREEVRRRMRVEVAHRRKLPDVVRHHRTGDSERLGYTSGTTRSWASQEGAEVTSESKRVECVCVCVCARSGCRSHRRTRGDGWM